MPSTNTEHFCTLFDSNFLAQGLCVHASLEQQARPFHLWILCMDEAVEQELRALHLNHTTLIRLRDLENPRLLAVKGGRSRGEYCWTLTPFLPAFILERDPAVTQITYLDADLFLFRDPRILLRELAASGKEVLITEHAYAPEYDQSTTSGRFCVQFLTFRNSEASRQVLTWWQDRCIEWCFARHEDGKFGDQKYLDDWPERFGKIVHVVEQQEKTLAPWNVRHYAQRAALAGKQLEPVFYHFHSLRILHPNLVRLYEGYRIGVDGQRLYAVYTEALKTSFARLKQNGIPIRALGHTTMHWWNWPKLAARILFKRVAVLW